MKNVLVTVIVLAATTAPALAEMSAEQLNAAEYRQIVAGGAPAKSMPPAVAADSHGCPPGSYWVEEGYARHAKWRPAHCATK